MYSTKTVCEYLNDLIRVRFGKEPRKALITLFEITTRCNLRCSYCYINEKDSYPNSYNQKELNFQDACKVIEEIKKSSRTLIFFGGEPFVREDFNKLVDYANSLGFDSLGVFTNGTTLLKNIDIIRKLDTLYISYDLSRKKQYPKLMEKLLKDVKKIKEKTNVKIMFDTTLNEEDKFSDFEPFLSFVEKNNCIVMLQPVRDDWDVKDFKWFNTFMEKARKKYSRKLFYNQNIKRYNHENIKFCLPKLMLFIDSMGNLIYPCEKFMNHKIGSLVNNSVQKLWEKGIKKYGVFPCKRCGLCGCTGYWEVSYNFRHPFKSNLFIF